MDEDTIMRDEETSEYPIPTEIEPTPYPSLQKKGRARRFKPNSSSNTRTSRRLVVLKFSTPEKARLAGLVPTQPSSHVNLASSTNSYDNSKPDDNHHGLTEDAAPQTNGDATVNADGASHGTAHDEVGEPPRSAETVGKRGRGRSRGKPQEGRRRKGWKWALQGTDHADIFSKPKKTRGSYKKRGRPPGRPKVSVNATGEDWLDPGSQFREYQGHATKAWLDGDNETALQYAKQAVQVNSEVFMAHKMIHDILQSQGDERGAVVALSVGGSTKRDPELWSEVADRILALEDRSPEDEEWARTCYVEAIRLQRDCYSARTGKLRLAEELGDFDSARLECKAIAMKWPEDLDYAHKYAELCIMVQNSYEWERAKDAYERSFDWYADQDMLGHNADEQWTHLNVYMDLLMKLGLYHGGVKQLKRLARWFLGRKEDVFWDEITDDREFDITDERRMLLPQFQEGRISCESSRYGAGLPLELRVKLGILRLKTGQREEAFAHFELFKAVRSEAENYEDLFLEVADCMRSYGLFHEALEYYQAVKALQTSSKQHFWLGIAQCYNAVGRLDQAEHCYLIVAQTDEDHVEARVHLARLYDATGQHEKASNMADEVTRLGRTHRPSAVPSRRLPPLLPKPWHANSTKSPFVNSSVVPPRGKGSNGLPRRLMSTGLYFETEEGSSPGRAESTNGEDGMPNLTEELAFDSSLTKKDRVQNHYSQIKTLTHFLAKNDDEDLIKRWIHHADAFLDEFRRTSKFYTAVENQYTGPRMTYLPQMLLQEMAGVKQRAGDGNDVETGGERMPTAEEIRLGNFHGITYGECHQVFSELSILYAKRADQERCYDTIYHGLIRPIIFRLDSELWNTTQAVRMCCAMIFSDGKLMVKVAQEYIHRGKKRSGMALQLFAAVGRLSYGTSSFSVQRTREWIHDLVDELRADLIATDLGPSTQDGESTNVAPSLSEEPDDSQHEIDPGLLMICGHQTLGTYQSSNARPALPYFLRALALQPDNVTVILSIALTYIANAMRKYRANRDDDIIRGQAFFQRYYDLRVARGKASDVQEAEFNLARLWHQLGRTHLAVQSYQKVLKLSDDVRREYAEEKIESDPDAEDFALEAAFALQGIFVAAGNEDAARAIAEEWLVL